MPPGVSLTKGICLSGVLFSGVRSVFFLIQVLLLNSVASCVPYVVIY